MTTTQERINEVTYQGIERYLSGETQVRVKAYRIKGEYLPELYAPASEYAAALRWKGDHTAAGEIEGFLSLIETLAGEEVR